MSFLIGVDLGQTNDYTAVAVLEQLEQDDEDKSSWRYECRFLERLPLHTTYPAIVRHLVALSSRDELLSGPAFEAGWSTAFIGGGMRKGEPVPRDRRPDLVVDATGVGRPVVDMLHAAGLKPIAITIHGGDTAIRAGRDWRVPKRDLVSTVQVLLQSERLKIATALPFARTLTDELLKFRVKISELTAHDSYGSWREGDHDDLVLAAAVAAWYGEERPEPPDRDFSSVARVYA